MKKSLLLSTAMLCCSLAFAQEAEGDQFLVIPRLDLNPSTALSSDGYKGFGIGNTSLYTLLEGNIGESDFSYSIENHWLSSSPASLYANTGYNDVNWLDWAYVCYTAGSFDFTLGKDVMALGTFEIDEYDFNTHLDLASTMWSNMSVYQWAVKAGWTTPDEGSYFNLQVCTSPFSLKPFSSNLFAYSIKWTGEYGPYSAIWSANMMEYDHGQYASMLAMGNKFTLGDFELGVDASFRGYDGSIFDEGAVALFANWAPSEKLNLSFKGGYEYNRCHEDVTGWIPNILEGDDPADYFVPASLVLCKNGNYVYGGAVAEYNLLDNLKIHAVAAANTWSKSLSLTVGARYYFDFKPLIFK